MDDNVRTLGSITVRQKDRELYVGKTVSGKTSTGDADCFHVTDDKVDVVLGYIRFINGERDVRTLKVQREHKTFGRLIHGLRLAILPTPADSHSLYAELRQAYLTSTLREYETLHPTTHESTLDEGAQISVFEELRKVGAIVGTRQELIGDTGKKSKHLCARFSKENLWAPVIAYVATRIMPISWGYTGVVPLIRFLDDASDE